MMKVLVLFLVALEAYGQIYPQPEQIHLSYGSPTSMQVTWSTLSQVNESVVEYGVADLSSRTSRRSFRFVDGGPKNRSQWIHSAEITGLKPGQKYLYHVGSSLGWSDLYNFTTMKSGIDWSPTFAVFGDMGNENVEALPFIQQEAQRGQVTAVLHTGDFAYDLDTDNGLVGDAFMNQIQSIAAYIPYMTCAGNHEKAYNFSHYKNRFSLPRSQPYMFSSFNIATAHIISVNTEVYIKNELSNVTIGTQYNWLEKDLQEANKNRNTQPWIIVIGHRPMYCSNSDGPVEHCNNPKNPIRVGIDIKTRQFSLEDLFYKYGVDLQFYAHEHSYERMWPVYKEKVCNGSTSAYTEPKGPVQIVTGSGGNREGQTKFNKVPYKYSAFRSDDFGYTRMTVHNGTHLSLQQVSSTAGGKVIDSLTIVRQKHGIGMFDCA